MVAAAVGAAAVAGSLYSSHQQSNAIEDAADKQQAASDAGVQFQYDALNQQQQNLSPFRNLTDRAALNKFYGMGVGKPDYSYDPNKDGLLNNALNRATRAVMDSQSANGKLGSGSTLTSLAEAMAPIYMNRQQQVFEQKYNTNNQQYNQLAQMIGMSQNAAAGQGAATQNATNNITSLMANNANAQGAAGIAQANNQANTFNNLLSAGMMAYGAYNRGA